MKNTLNDEVKSLIEKNLPKQVGEILQGRLTELEKIALNYDALQEKHEKLLIENKEISEIVNDFKSKEVDYNSKFEKYKTDKEAFDKNQLAAEVEKYKYKLEESEKRADLSKEFLLAVFKNPTFKTHEQHVGYMPVSQYTKDYNGNIQGFPTNMPFTNNVTSQTVQED